MLTKRDDPAHKKKSISSLTEPSTELVPIMAALGTSGRKWLPASEEAIDPGAQPLPGSPLLISSVGWRRSDCLVCRRTQRG